MTIHADRILRDVQVYARVDRAPLQVSIAIQSGRIVALGSGDDLMPLAGPETEIDDFPGATVLPGLTDGHIHISGYAQARQRLDCFTADLESLVEAVASRANELDPGEWILGHGWDQNRWDRWPTATDFVAASAGHPLYLSARSMHAAVCNQSALEICGIDRNTPDPPDGAIERDKSGRPTGILLEGAMNLVSQQITKPNRVQLAEMIAEAQQALWSIGITGIHDFDGRDAFEALQLLHQRGELGLRVLKQVQARYLDAAAELGLRPGFGDSWLRLGNIKVFADGALGPRTAAMIKPYSDEPGNRGMLLLDREQLLEIGIQAAEQGFAMTIHAIGDRANHEALSALAQLRDRYGHGHWQLPHRIEHLQLMPEQDLARPAELGILASMQPVHAVSDQDMAQAGWADRAHLSYAWRSILGHGAMLVFGSDAPVEDPNPFWGLHAAVHRSWRQAGAEAWIPEQRIDLADALLAYTLGPATAAGLSHVSGQIAPGCFADLIVLPVDPFEVPAARLHELAPIATMVGGEWRFRAA